MYSALTLDSFRPRPLIGRSGPKRRPFAERFWALVERGEGCWTWLGAHNGRYGQFAIDGMRNEGAHRVAFVLAIGPIAEGLCVLHRCDNPRCVRPDHLFLGTVQDNSDDMMAKGRHHTQRTKR